MYQVSPGYAEFFQQNISFLIIKFLKTKHTHTSIALKTENQENTLKTKQTSACPLHYFARFSLYVVCVRSTIILSKPLTNPIIKFSFIWKWCSFLPMRFSMYKQLHRVKERDVNGFEVQRFWLIRIVYWSNYNFGI